MCAVPTTGGVRRAEKSGPEGAALVMSQDTIVTASIIEQWRARCFCVKRVAALDPRNKSSELRKVSRGSILESFSHIPLLTRVPAPR